MDERSGTPVGTDTTPLELDIKQSKVMRPGDDHYRAYVGPPGQYDFMGATQFALLYRLGIREEHRVLDVGCGSLRAGRYLIQFLMPGRYHGIEPNEDPWREAVEKEIGRDVLDLKQPSFATDPDFGYDLFGVEFDFIVAQSIFSHTGANLLGRGLEQGARTLAVGGQYLFTVLDETAAAYGKIDDGRNATGWFYPACVTFPLHDIESRCADVGLHVQALDWFHPRQRWFRAVADSDRLLTPAMISDLGTGRPLFDPRFE